MSDLTDLEALFTRLGTPASGRELILGARQNAPVRVVRSRGGNVLTQYQSRKMGRPIETESRHLEFPAVIGHEYDPRVLEYYPQPCVFKFQFIDQEGEVHNIEHTPDILVITENSIWLEEWKPWDKLVRRAQRFPWRYEQVDDHWESSPVRDWLAKHGIGYRICTERDIPQRRIENLLILEDYLAPDSPPGQTHEHFLPI